MCEGGGLMMTARTPRMKQSNYGVSLVVRSWERATSAGLWGYIVLYATERCPDWLSAKLPVDEADMTSSVSKIHLFGSIETDLSQAGSGKVLYDGGNRKRKCLIMVSRSGNVLSDCGNRKRKCFIWPVKRGGDILPDCGNSNLSKRQGWRRWL